MKRPDLSVVMPTYNQARFIKAALDSVFRQEPCNFEVVVVNDGSTDATDRILSRYSGRIRYFKKEHTNVSQALNLGINNARGKYIMIVDSDDILLPGAMKQLLQAINRRGDLDFVYGDIIIADRNGRARKKITYRDYRDSSDVIPDLVEQGGYSPFPGASTIIKKKFLLSLGGFDPSFSSEQDFELWVRALSAGCKFKHLRLPVYIWRWHKGQLDGPKLESAMIVKILRSILGSFSLRQLYPDLDWSDEDAARASAIDNVFKAFSKWGITRKELLIYYMRNYWDGNSKEIRSARQAIDWDSGGEKNAFDESGRICASWLLARGLCSSSSKVLDIGCGMGRIMKALSPFVKEIHGVDISSSMINKARKYLAGIGNVALHLGAGDSLQDFKNAQFDLVVAFWLAGHLPKEILSRYLKEISRTLKPGKFLLLQRPTKNFLGRCHSKALVPNHPAYPHSKRAILKMARHNGLKLVKEYFDEPLTENAVYGKNSQSLIFERLS
ncbi:MAG: glycosyltransferase [Candidatus Margulisiibacteriota bacterium]